MLLKWNGTFFRTAINFFFRTSKEKTHFHYGIGNRCKGGLYCVFLDYDNTPREWILEELAVLQHKHHLGNAHLWSTKHGMHVIFLDKVPLKTLLIIMQDTTCDDNYRLVPLHHARKVWVLRQTNKNDETIQYAGSLQHKSTYQKSNAHKEYLIKFTTIPVTEITKNTAPHEWDHETSIILGDYKIADTNN